MKSRRFSSSFPDGLIFGNTFDGSAFDTVLVGPASPLEIDLEAIDGALRSPALYARRLDRSAKSGMYGAHDLFGNYAGRARDLAGWTGARADQPRSQPAAAVSGRAELNRARWRSTFITTSCGIAGSRTICSSARRPRCGAFDKRLKERASDEDARWRRGWLIACCPGW